MPKRFGEPIVRKSPKEYRDEGERFPWFGFEIDGKTLEAIEAIEQNARTAAHRLRFVVMD